MRPIPRDYIRSTEHAPGSQAVIDEMIEKLEDYSAKVVVVSKESEVTDAISTFLANQKASSVVVPTGLDDAFKKAAARDGRTVREDSREQAIPTLGTGRDRRGRHALPRCHLYLRHHRSRRRARPGSTRDHARARHPTSSSSKAADIVPTVPQAVDILGKNPTRPMTWIAGGSATSDIELVRVNGVHGPRFLRVVIVK